MPIVATDWSVDRQTGVIDYTGDDHLRFGGTTPSYATVIEFYRWIQGLADDPEWTSGSADEVDIISLNPATRSTDNFITLTPSYTITDAAIEHLYDGTILQSSDGTRWDGIVNFGNSSIIIQIQQDGSILTDDWWNLSGGGGLNASAAAGISHRFMLKTINAGSDVDGRRLLGLNRTYGNTYGEFSINGTSAGNNVLALADSSDLNNPTAEGTVATYDKFTNQSEGYDNTQDIDELGGVEPYYSRWAIVAGTQPSGTATINDLYEYAKYITRDGATATTNLYGIAGEQFRGITHEIALSGTSSGTFSAFEAVSWTGGSGRMLAIDNTTASSATKMWIQLLAGVPPTTELITGGTSLATATATGNTPRPIDTPFIGVSTGSAIIGAYGVGFLKANLSNNDTLTDLNDATINPPTLTSFTVNNVVIGEDRVLVAPWDGTTTDVEGNPEVDFNQMTQSALVNGAAVTSVTVNSIPVDTPQSGITIRVETNSGKYKRCEVSSWTGSTFTITSTDFSAADDQSDGTGTPKNVFIGYIDKLATGTSESIGITYSADRNLVVKVRDGAASPIKEFISPAAIEASPTSLNAIRTTDA